MGDAGYSVVNENKESRVMPRKTRDFDKEDKEIADDLVGNANGHARLIPEDEQDAEEKKKKKDGEKEEE